MPPSQTFDKKCIKKGIFNPPEYICKLYKRGLSCNEIAEKMQEDHQISITAKSISEKIKAIMPLRSYSERKKNAIKRGRMVYIKKPDHEKYKRFGLSQKIRMEILTRDNFKCTICGNGPQTGYSIEIHHINGPENNPENLQTLCFQCHRGLHSIKKENKIA